MSRLTETVAAFGIAMQFMTRLPIPGALVWTPERQSRSVYHYPLAGCVVGVIAAGVLTGAGQLFEPLLAALLVVAAAVAVTGALHEDGLADCCDALGGHADRERALEIMRDSRIGTYGVAGLGVVLAAKVLALAETPPGWAPWLLIAAHTLSRALAVMVMACSRYVRPRGAASGLDVPRSAVGLLYAGAVTGLVLACGLYWPGGAVPGATIAAIAAGALAAALLTWRWYANRLGGYTGDCLGATVVVSELGAYLVAAALH